MKTILSYIQEKWVQIDFSKCWKESLIALCIGFFLGYLSSCGEAKSTISTISSLCVTFVTIFTFYKTHVSWGVKEANICKYITSSNGKGISLFLKNESLMPKTITSVHLLIDNHYIMKIKSYERPVVINPYSYLFVELRYTFIQKELDTPSPLCGERISYIITTPENVYIIDCKGKIIDRLSEYDFHIKYQNFEKIETYSVYFNGDTISSIVRYGLVVESDGARYYYLIEKNGFVDFSLPWHENKIDEKHLCNKETLMKYLNAKIAELKTLDFKIVKIVDFKFYPRPQWVVKQNETQI